MNRRCRFTAALCAVVWCAGGCRAAASEAPVSPTVVSSALQVPAAAPGAAPAVSAAADDPAWQAAAVIPSMSLALHSPKTDAVLPTQMRLLWDKDWLYIRFTSTGPEPYAPFGAQRDAMHYKGDVVEVFLDPVGDARQYFEIQLSPANGVLDQNTVLTTDAQSDAGGKLLPAIVQRDYWPNLGYEMKDLRTASKVIKEGEQWTWIADFALPAAAVLKRTGKKQYEPMPLRINLIRYRSTGPIDQPGRKMIAMNWRPVKWGQPHQSPAAMGTIELVPAKR